MQDHKKTQLNGYQQQVGCSINHDVIIEAPKANLFCNQLELSILKAESLKPSELEQLWHSVSAEPDAQCWTYLPYAGFDSQQQLKQSLLENFNMPTAQHYLIRFNQRCVGWIGLLNLRPRDRVLEIGNVYFSALMKQSTVATQTIYLLLAMCFEQGYRRVEWKCDELNTPSYRAALRFGFCYEGTFRQDRIIKGRNRNTAWFSMLDDEWPQLKLAYEAWLSPDNFDAEGLQKLHLNDFKALYQKIGC